MKALVQSTPDVADRGAIRDVRRTASKIAGMGEDQYSKAAQDIIEVLENRMRLATRYQPQAESAAHANSLPLLGQNSRRTASQRSAT